LSADGGLLWWAPLAPLALFGLGRLACSTDVRWRAEARVTLGVLVIYGVVTSGLSFDGGWRVGPRYMVVVLPALALGWAQTMAELRDRPIWIAGVTAVATYAFVVNALAANLWPHFDLDNVHHPVGEVLLPLWERGVEPYGMLRAMFNIDGVRLVVVGTVAGGLLAWARTLQLTGRSVIGFTGGMLLGLAAVAATRTWPPHPNGARNLGYIVRAWEPRQDAFEPPASTPLPPLAPGAADAEPVRRSAN
jgi:hypothetical protein